MEIHFLLLTKIVIIKRNFVRLLLVISYLKNAMYQNANNIMTYLLMDRGVLVINYILFLWRSHHYYACLCFLSYASKRRRQLFAFSFAYASVMVNRKVKETSNIIHLYIHDKHSAMLFQFTSE